MYNNIFFVVTLIIIISGCAGQSPAPVEYNNSKFSKVKTFEEDEKHPVKTVAKADYTQDHISEEPLSIKKEELSNPAGVLKATDTQENQLPAKNANIKTIYYEVHGEDTLEKIAERYEQTADKLAELNNLTPPYNLKEFQIIRIEVSQELLNKINKIDVRDKNEQTNEDHMQFIMPIDGGKIINAFGQIVNDKKNYGINISAEAGSDVKSVADGKVIYSDFDKKFGNLIIVKLTKDDLYAAYAHMKGLMLEQNAIVKQGQVIGHVGATGDVASPQLHFAIRKGKTSIDPMIYLKH